MKTLHQLEALGARKALDDVGTGYSSLSHLRSFPFNQMKIDVPFVADLEIGTDTAAIIHAVANLDASLGITTTAESIETEAQFDRARDEDVTQVQDYPLGHPLDTRDFHALLSTEQSGKHVAETPSA